MLWLKQRESLREEFRELLFGITEKPRELRKERKLCMKWREVLHSSYTRMERWRLLEPRIDLMARKDSSHLRMSWAVTYLREERKSEKEIIGT
jgi:hypothetical protein